MKIRTGGAISTTKLIMGNGLGRSFPLSCSSKNNISIPEYTGLIVVHTTNSASHEYNKGHARQCIEYAHGFVFQSDVHNRVESGDSTVNKQGLNPVATEVCHEDGLTCYVEAGAVVSTDTRGSRMSVVRPSSDVLISEFLARPILLSAINWASSSVNGSTIATIDPSSYLVTGDWAEKLRGFQLFRGTFVIRIELNPSPFMAGALLGSWMPHVFNTISQPGTLVGAYQLPHVLVTTRDTAAEFRIPFISPYQYHDKSEPAAARACWGAFRLMVASQLAIGATSPYSNVSLAIYGHWEDVDITAPILPQSNMTFESFRSNKPISKGLKSVSKVAGAFKGVPVIGTMAATVEWAASLAGGVASALGFGKPIAQEPGAIMVPRINPYTHLGEGPVTHPSMATLSNPGVASTDECTYTDEDEMSLEYLYKVPNYVSSIAWSGSNVNGTVLMQRALSPRMLIGTTATATAPVGTVTYTHGGPLNYLSHMFTMWRGSLNLHLKFVKTGFHTGRIQIVWTPFNDATLSVAPTIANSMFTLRHIVDIRDQDEYVVNLPYLVRDQYLRTGGTDLPSTYMGTVTVSVLNELRYPETVASTIQMLEFYTAGDDFEFQAPGICEAEPFAFQSNMKFMTTGVSRSLGPSVHCASESITSLKQLTDKDDFSTAYSGAVGTVTNQSIAVIDPWYSGYTLLPTSASASRGNIDTMSFVGAMYAYQVGSVNVALMLNNAAIGNVCYVPYYLSSLLNSFGTFTYTHCGFYHLVRSASAVTPAFDTPNALGTPINANWPIYRTLGSTKYSSYGLNTQVSTPVIGYCMEHAHYVAKYPVSFISHSGGALNAAATAPNADTMPYPAGTFVAALQFSTSIATGYRQYRSTGDDFRFKAFTGCPYLLITPLATTI